MPQLLDEIIEFALKVSEGSQYPAQTYQAVLDCLIDASSARQGIQSLYSQYVGAKRKAEAEAKKQAETQKVETN